MLRSDSKMRDIREPRSIPSDRSSSATASFAGNLHEKNYEVTLMIPSADDAGANAAQLTSGLGKD